MLSLTTVLTALTVVAQLSAWPMSGHDRSHTGRAGVSGPVSSDTLWTFKLGGQPVLSSTAPVLLNDGTIIICTQPGSVFAIWPNRTQRWRTVLNNGVIAAPAVAANGRLVVPTADTTYVLSPDGVILWRVHIGNVLGSATVKDNFAFVASQDGYIWKLDVAADSVVWQSDQLRHLEYSSPLLGTGGQVLIGTVEHVAFAVSSGLVDVLDQNGHKSCEYDLGFYRGQGIRSSLLQTAAGNVLGASVDNASGGYGDGVYFNVNVACADACTPSDINHRFSSPALRSDGIVVVGTLGGLATLNGSGCNPTGLIGIGPISDCSPILDVDNVAYVANDNGLLSAVRPDGSIRWSFQLDGFPTSGALGGDGSLYIASEEGTLYAFRGPNAVSVEPGQFNGAGLHIYPNPGRDVQFDVTLPEPGCATVDVFDISGRHVARVASACGTTHLTGGLTSARIGSGVFFARLTVNGRTTQARRLVVLR